MQVQQQVIEVINYIASTATKFPKKCVVLCLQGKYSWSLGLFLSVRGIVDVDSSMCPTFNLLDLLCLQV